MRRQAWFSWLAIALGCRAAGPTKPAAAVNPVLVTVLAEVDEALVGQPTDGVLLYQRASIMLPLGAKPAEVVPFLERLDASGWNIPLADADFGALVGDARYRELAARIAARAPHASRSAVAFSVPGSDLIPEGIAVDPTSGTFYLGSLHKRTIVAIDPSGVSRRFVPERQDGLLGVTGVKVDPARGVLWAASHASHSMEGRQPGGRDIDGVYAFALADGSLRRRAVFSDGGDHLANDLAIATNGTAYLTDSASGAVYRVPPDHDVLEIVVPPRTFAYPNGLALADDGHLYVADAIGIALVSLDTHSVKRVTAPPLVALGGIDGMVLQGNQIFAVQNSIGQPRIVAIAIEGDRATGLTVLENAPDALAQPTTTCLWQGALYTIANAQLNAFGPEGLRPGQTLADPQILRTPR
jgi:xanthosine utilization system XapX-like protein